MIELKNVSKFYNDNNIVTIGLKNASLKLNKGEFVAITGDSGSGKSTLLNVISLIDTYDEGEMLYYGNETFYFNQNDCDEFRKNNVAFIFQKYNIIDSYTVLQNVMLPLLIKGKTETEAKAEAVEIIKRVGLGHRINNKGTKLSGGEKQRCVIARALATDAPILACDEPTGNLDSQTSKEIINLIKEVSKDKLVLIVTHDYEAIKDICTRKIKLSDGEIVEDITFKEGIEEENKEVVLRKEKPAKKTLWKLALSNVLSTPKQTIFTSLVFIFVSCVFLLLSLFMVKVSYEANFTYSDSYGILSEDRMIIYSKDHSSLDMAKLQSLLKDSEYYENAFYEESNNSMQIGDGLWINGAVTFHELDFELLAGTDEVNAGEFVLVMSDLMYFEDFEYYIGQEVKLMETLNYDGTVSLGKLVGVGISEEVGRNYLMGSELDEKVVNLILNNEVALRFSSPKTEQTYLSQKYNENIEKSYLLIPNELKDTISFDFNIKNLYGVFYDLAIVYSDDAYAPTLVLGNDYMNGEFAPDFDGVKEISVYTDNIRKLTKEVNKLGLAVSIPSQVESEDSASLILLYVLMGFVFVALVIMFYISFAILQRIYLTKTKDYSIFRTLGLVSNDLKKTLYIEVIAITLFSMLAGVLLSNVIIVTSAIDLYKYVSLTLLVLYTLTMLVFGVLTAIRLNNKIFKYSVYQAIKEGGE